MTRDLATEQVARIPPEWQVEPPAAAALAELLCGRAAFVAGMIIDGSWPDGSASQAN